MNREKLVRWFVWKLPPYVVMWCFIRVWANATSGEYSNVHPDSIGWTDAFDRWEARQGGDPAWKKDKVLTE